MYEKSYHFSTLHLLSSDIRQTVSFKILLHFFCFWVGMILEYAKFNENQSQTAPVRGNTMFGQKDITGKCKSHWFYLWTLKIRNNFEGNKKLRTIHEHPKILNSFNSSNTPPKRKRGKIVGKENTCTDFKSTFPPSGGHKNLL